MATYRKYQTRAGSTYWEAFASLGRDSIGKSQRVHKRGFKTKKEAQLWTSNVQVEFEKQGVMVTNEITFQALYDKWFTDYQQGVKESTWAKTGDVFRLHILPVLGTIQIKQLTVSKCQSVVYDWFNNGFKHYRRFRTNVIAVLNYGIRMELITRNPMEKTNIPKRRDSQPETTFDFYEKEELSQFLHAAYLYDSMEPFTFFRLLSFTGMRKSEALALTWGDVNFTTNEVSINKTESKGAGGRLVIQTPKTQTSSRTITVDVRTMQWLQKWRLNQTKLYFELGFNTRNDQQLVFSNQYNELFQPSAPDHWNRSICKAYNLRRIKIHAFRHTFCTLSFEAGATLNEVSKTLGHSDLRITQQIYLHVTKKQKLEAATKLEKYMDM